ncbi:MAG: molybdopterin adenylyltransferase [Actinobacteria bacterium]|nr:molybdopterin adenylyltransferase [Actinomycetota bacterium]
MKTRIGVVAVSDRASTGVYEDKGIPAICAFLDSCITSEYEYITRLIPDEQATISDTLVELADVEHCSLIVTTGGTGPALRDVTPEATEAICQKMLPGFGELMRQVSLQIVPTAILSRQSAGIRGTSLIINLPGKPSAIAECLVAVMPAVPDCISVIGGSAITLNDTFGTYLPHSS